MNRRIVQPGTRSAATVAVLLVAVAFVLYQMWRDSNVAPLPAPQHSTDSAGQSPAGTTSTPQARTPTAGAALTKPAGIDPHSPLPSGIVLRVVDGDTLLLRDHKRVRLLGVDTPETVKQDTPVKPWGPEASSFTRALLASGTPRLEYDRERTDDYGRTLAYVWVTLPDGQQQMLNEELLRAGLARGLFRHPYSEAMKDRFHAAIREAQRAKRGIWSGKTPTGEPLKWPFGNSLN